MCQKVMEMGPLWHHVNEMNEGFSYKMGVNLLLQFI